MAPLKQRPIDLILIGTFLGFAFTSFIFDPYTALDVDLAKSESPPAQLIYWFATNVDPLVLHPPLFVRIMVGLSVVLLGPTYLLLAYGLWRDSAWIRTPALAYSSIKLYSMAVYLGVALFGETEPRDYVLFFLVYLPYLIAPLALLWRLRRNA